MNVARLAYVSSVETIESVKVFFGSCNLLLREDDSMSNEVIRYIEKNMQFESMKLE